MLQRKAGMYLIDMTGQIVHVNVPKRNHYHFGQPLSYYLSGALTVSGQAIYGLDLFESDAEAQNRLNEIVLN